MNSPQSTLSVHSLSEPVQRQLPRIGQRIRAKGGLYLVSRQVKTPIEHGVWAAAILSTSPAEYGKLTFLDLSNPESWSLER